MPYSEVTWSYRDPITVSKLTQMDDNSVWTAERSIFGCDIDITSGANTAIVGMGKMEFGGVWRYRNSAITAIHPNAAGDWEEGNTDAFLSSTTFYVVATEDTGASFNVKFRASGPAYSDTDDTVFARPLLYDKTGAVYFRYIGICHTNTASAFIPTNCYRIGD